jgi:hypothetical protein
MTEDFLEDFFTIENSKTLDDNKQDPTNEEEEVEILDPIEDPSQTEPIDEEESPKGDEVITGYIEFLKANDLIDLPEDLEQINGTPEELEKIFEHTKKARIEKTVDTIMSSLPDDFKPLFEYALAGGTSIQEFMSVYGPDPVDSISLEDPNSQRLVLKEYYQRTTQYSPEKIDRMISYLSDPEDLRTAAEEAMEDLKDLKEQEKRRLIESKAEENQRQAEAAKQRTVELAASIDNSSTIHPQRKHKVKSFFFEPVQIGQNTTTQFNHVIQTILQNPAHQAQLGDILLEYDPEKGFILDRLEKKVKTKAAQGFRQLIEETLGAKPKGGKSSTTPQSKTSIDWERFLEQ